MDVANFCKWRMVLALVVVPILQAAPLAAEETLPPLSWPAGSQSPATSNAATDEAGAAGPQQSTTVVADDCADGLPRSLARFRWFLRCRPACPPCQVPQPTVPMVEPPDTKPPITPPTVMPTEPMLGAVTTAALGSAALSVNMYGDQGAGGGKSSISILKKFATAPGSMEIFTDSSNSRLVFDSLVGDGIYYTVPLATFPFPITTADGPFDLDGSQPDAVPPQAQIFKGKGIVDVDEVIDSSNALGHVEYFLPEQIFFNIANPAAGGVVGRQKIAEDNNALPRDRFIFNYDFFGGTPLTASGLDIHRVVLGIEKTFFDQMTSIEVRVPLACTLDSDTIVGAQSTHTEVGNVRVTFKGLLWSGPILNVGAGAAVYVPSADDTRVFLDDGTELVRIENETFVVTPFIGALWTPTPRCFLQGWLACNFDTSGNPVFTNDDFTTPRFAGRLNEAAGLEADMQVGCWLLEPGTGAGRLQGLAPFVELHYGGSMQDADVVASSLFIVGDLRNRVDELNFAAGVAALVGNNLFVSAGAVVPLKGDDSRTFDYQLGVRANFFFGPTARSRLLAPYGL